MGRKIKLERLMCYITKCSEGKWHVTRKYNYECA